MQGVNRGEVFDIDLGKVGVRPGIVVTRQQAIPVLARVAVVGITSTVRGHPAEVPLDRAHGLDHDCVANCDDIFTISKQRLVRRRGALEGEDMDRLDRALGVALGLSYVDSR